MGKTILIAVLDWGFGHATRMTPVIDGLIELGATPILASSGKAAEYLRDRYPNYRMLEMPSPKVVYNHKGARRALLSRSFRQSSINKLQYKWTQHTCQEFDIDAIISDNVYGVYCKSLPSVIITHQVGLMAPIFKSIFDRTLAKWLNKFDVVWIPDMPGVDSLAGEMTVNHHFKGKRRFLGRLSRLKAEDNILKDCSALAIASGPEPQRTAFETFALERFSKIRGSKILVRGGIGLSPLRRQVDTDVFNFLDGQALARAILRSEQIFCRAGYSTLCDLLNLGVSATIVPTPQQPEQIYLAKRCAELGWFSTLDLEHSRPDPGKVNLPRNDKALLHHNLIDFMGQI